MSVGSPFNLHLHYLVADSVCSVQVSVATSLSQCIRFDACTQHEAMKNMSVLTAVAERETRDYLNSRKSQQMGGKSDGHSTAERMGNRRKRVLSKVRSGDE